MTLQGTLLETYVKSLVMMDRITVPDGYGGFEVQWKEGAEFKASVIDPQSNQAKIAEAVRETKRYTIVTETNVTLLKDDYFKRVDDGTVFRVVKSNTDTPTPADSAVPMRVTEAEITELPT